MSYAPVAIGSEPVACTTSIDLSLSEAWVQELDELIPETTAPVAELETTYTDNRAEISRLKWAMIRTHAFFMYYVIMIRDIFGHAWRSFTGIFRRNKKDTNVQFPVQIILRRQKVPKRRRARQSTPAKAPETKPIPAVLKKLAPAAKAVTTMANRATTNLRKAQRGPELAALRRRLAPSSPQNDVPGRRRSSLSTLASSYGSLWSSASSAASSGTRGFLRSFAPNDGRRVSHGSLPPRPRPQLISRLSTKLTKPTFRRRSVTSSCIPSRSSSLSSDDAYTPSSPVLVGAAFVKSTAEGQFELIRTSIDETPESAQSESEDSSASSEGNLSADSGSINFMNYTMRPREDAIREVTASGPLGYLGHQLERTVTTFHNAELVV